MADADTGRVLARSHGLSFTAGRVLQVYRDMSPLSRRRIETPAALIDLLQRLVLEPDIVDLARAEGLERDPGVVAQLERWRETRLVQRLHEDSVQARIRVTEEMRRRYYRDHEREFVTRERVRYAVIPRMTEAGADSVTERLAHRESPAAILAADSLSGMPGGFVRDLLEGQPHSYYNVLFEELRPGQSTKFYLGKDAVWAVFHVLSHDASRPMSYDEARGIVDQSVENIESQRLLSQMTSRRTARCVRW